MIAVGKTLNEIDLSDDKPVLSRELLSVQIYTMLAVYVRSFRLRSEWVLLSSTEHNLLRNLIARQGVD